MKIIRRLGLLCGLILALGAGAGEAESREATLTWLKGYRQLEAAQQQEKAAHPEAARELYARALKVFVSVRATYPNWHPGLLEFRINYCQGKIAALTPTGNPRDDEAGKGEKSGQQGKRLRESKEQIKQLNLALAKAHREAALGSQALEQLNRLLRANRRLRQESKTLAHALKELSADQKPNPHKTELDNALLALAQERRQTQARHKKLTELIRKQQAELAVFRAELKKLSLGKLGGERKRPASRATVKKLETKLKDAQELLTREKRQAAALKRAVKAARTKEKALQENNTELLGIIARLEKEGDTTRGKLPTLLRPRLEQLGKLRVQLRQEQRQRIEIEKKHKGSRMDLDVLQAANFELRKELNILLAGGHAELAQELGKALADLNTKYRQGEKKRQDLENKYQDMLEIARALQTKLQSVKLDAHKTPNTEKELKTANVVLGDQLKEQKTELTWTRRQLKQLQQQMRQTETQSELAEELMAELLEELVASRAELARGKLRPEADNGPGAAEAADVKALLERAQEAEKQAKGEAARGLYAQVLALAPRQFDALVWTGRFQAATGKLEEAEHLLTQASRLKPADAALLKSLGSVLLQNQKALLAIGVLSRAAHHKPKDAGVQRLLGRALGAAGWPAAAETQLVRAWNLNPHSPETALALAILYANWPTPRMKLARRWYSMARKLGAAADPKLARRIEL